MCAWSYKNKDLSIASGKEIVFQIQQGDLKSLLSYERTNQFLSIRTTEKPYPQSIFRKLLVSGVVAHTFTPALEP